MTPPKKVYSHYQNTAPLIDILNILKKQQDAAFYAPGHKRGQGINSSLSSLLGKKVFQSDLPELPELGNLFIPDEAIEKAQNLAAEAFGARRTWFLINGSSCGIVAAILAVCNPGDKIIVPRNIHHSITTGLIMSGAVPIFLYPKCDSKWNLPLNITPSILEATLEKYHNIKAVLIIHPTYHGICGNISEIVKITHSYNIPLLVDEAHGAHFQFHEILPSSALSAGADLSVQSTHKVLSAMTQASMLHIQGNLIDEHRINQTLQFIQSSSPSSLLLASLDGARQQIVIDGHKLLNKTIKLSKLSRNKINDIDGFSTLSLVEKKPEFYDLDITRLTVDISSLGVSGWQVDKILRTKLNVTAELPMLSSLTFIISIGNTEEDITALVKAFLKLKKIIHSSSSGIVIPSSPCNLKFFSSLSISPRDAFFASKKIVFIEKSIGLISGEMLCPYPPGIPTIMPGEVITNEAIEYLLKIKQQGGIITGCSNKDLKTIKVICSKSTNYLDS
ncbi:MAG: aminotransferase class I/II-fold pyridoxal phosphate-dependent enzyme [Candidatus Atelocyanobacterium thalassa]